MHFYLPNFEDLVDPDYDFEKDEYSPKRKLNGRFHHDKYAHEFYPEPIFDGMLVSKTVIKPSIEKRIQASGNVHDFFRLDKQIPIMGDCGAFSYLNDKKPPYTVSEILNYYERLGFTYGVALDHLIFPTMSEEERRRRFKITLDNAQEFLHRCTTGNYKVVPVGIVQGWDVASRRDTVRQLLDMGYHHLAIGGMARSKDPEIIQTLQAIHPLLQGNGRVKMLHLFGVARLSLIPEFIRYGVTSADSASPMRRAFLGTSEDNYWTTQETRYAAIRVPEVKVKAAKKRGVDSTDEVMARNGVTVGEMKAMEKNALRLLRAYDDGDGGLEETLTAILTYDELHGDKRDHEAAYRRTLMDKAWQQCGCPICEKWGIEVIIFRGNNRNRRRGFHNCYAFYKQFQERVKRETKQA
jgi:tRNA-guanine family transglycosylase